MDEAPFWRVKRLDEMTHDEWESLCDGCAKCCMVRLWDDDASEVVDTRIACRLLDQSTCRCTDYLKRSKRVPDCVSLTPQNIDKIDWLPATCAYRLVREGRDLPAWHHLRSGSRETIHEAGRSVRGLTISEEDVGSEEHGEHVVVWVDD